MIFDVGRKNHHFAREGRQVVEFDWFTQMGAETVKALVTLTQAQCCCRRPYCYWHIYRNMQV
jgi:hypothetical protein